MTKQTITKLLIVGELNEMIYTFPYQIVDNTYSLSMKDANNTVYNWMATKDNVNKQVKFSIWSGEELEPNIELIGYLKQNDLTIIEVPFKTTKTI